ncbi:unnamed protein product [Candidula unifasciata]|uniref:VASt domain-containing protein n=1 Tax=Candidula unifasciata TaxID=100452 RepID=A0A8S4A6Y8_9EUPU|nr:unnamed protein product [Candidula unifasciata]
MMQAVSPQSDRRLLDRKQTPSPLMEVRYRRYREVSSSQESLFTPPPLPRPSSQNSSAILKESDEGMKEGSSSFNSPIGSRSSTPDKLPNIFDGNPSFHDCLSDGERGFPDFSTNSSYEKRPRSALDNYDMASLIPRGIRDRSFERSLDNILDKCSEKSLDLTLPIDSWSSLSQDGGKSPDQLSGSSGNKASKSEKKKNRWYNIMSSTYKSRSEDYHKMFKDVPRQERLIVDYSCALQKDILAQGRMYISQKWICFYAKIFNWETMLMIQCKEIIAITKEKTARVIPNAIQITTEKDRYFFTSFGARDKTYMMLFRIWQNALLDQPMSPKELWTWVHYGYGDDLGLTSDDDDYVAPQALEELSEKLKEEFMSSKEEALDSETATTTAEHNHTLSTDDTDFVSDEVFSLSVCNRPLVKPILSIIPPDFLDSSDDSEGEYFCNGHNHLEKMYLDEVFSMNIDTVFECLFTDSLFFRNFVASRKTFDLSLGNWEDDLDDNGNKIRIITYTLTLNNSIGPKTSPSTEKQICYAMSRPGRIYHVDCECCNGGIPYADSFYAVLRYCLTRVSPVKCRVVVTGEVRYRKPVMGMFKGMIDKSAVNGLTDYCRQLSVHLRNEAQRLESIVVGHQMSAAKKKLRRKRVKTHAGVSEGGASSRQSYTERQMSTPPSPSKGVQREDRVLELNAHTLVRIISVILVLLFLFNTVLFYKLWSLETYASSLFGTPMSESMGNTGKLPRSQEEWNQLLQQQKNIHEVEVKKWQEVMSATIRLVEQIFCYQILVRYINLQSATADLGRDVYTVLRFHVYHVEETESC